MGNSGEGYGNNTGNIGKNDCSNFDGIMSGAWDLVNEQFLVFQDL